MKRLTCFLLALLLTVLVFSCKGKQDKSSNEDGNATTEYVGDGEDFDNEPNALAEVELKATKPQPIDVEHFGENLAEISKNFSRIQQRLVNDLLELDNSSPKALVESKDVLKKYFKNATAKQADSLYLAYCAYANNMISYVVDDEYYNQVPNDFFETYDSFDELPPVYQPIMDELNSYGIRLEDLGEGCADLSYYPDYFYELFKPYTTEATKEYLRLMAFERANEFLFDAAVCITWEELGDRIVSFEQYLDKYPNSMFANEIREMNNGYTRLLLVGCDNTPTLDRSNDVLKPYDDVRGSYNNIINTYRNRRITGILEEFCELLDRNKMTEARLDDFLSPFEQEYYEYD